MKVYKAIGVLIFMLSVTSSKAQVPALFAKYNIDAANHTKFYNRAIRLIDTRSPDSSYEAVNILWALSHYDSTIYNLTANTSLFERIDRDNIN
ncbi:MAG TPA: hypothetical protein VD998_02760, partial [Verrucomicrobiae bacterium]|nr:hypothetical protein [Verrucomicrobiae bacterium]